MINKFTVKLFIASVINVFGLQAVAVAQKMNFDGKVDILGLSSSCYSCHSDNTGSSSNMSLSNYDEKQFIDVFKRYRDQIEPNPNVMNYIAKGYTDREIEFLARYFSRKR